MTAEQLALRGIQLQFGSRVRDVEVAHGELADPVQRAERGVLGALHRQLVRVVGEGRPTRVEDRVVVAATQPQHDLAGHRRGDPPLQRLAKHERLGVEPTPFVEQPPKPPPFVVVVGDGVLVVDRRQQPLVGDEQQRHAGCFIDPAALGLDDPVLDLVGHAEPVAASDDVGLVDQSHRVGELLPVDRHRATLDEGDRDVLGGHVNGRVPEPHAHDRFDDLDRGVQVLQALGLVGRAPQVGVGRIGLLHRVAVGQAMRRHPLRHLGAPTELVDEVGVQPRLVDPQVGVGDQAVAVEPLDVVALVGRPVAPDVDAVLAHGAHQQSAGDGAAQGSGVEVLLAARADVERPAGQRRQPLLDERGAAVDQPRELRAIGPGAPRHRVDVGLVVLPDVGGVRAGDRSLVTHPGDGYRRVETAGECDADAFADRE